MREAPLVEGEWLDQYMVVLAEWGARLQIQGYELQEPEDSHLMAWYRVVDTETGADLETTALKQVWAQTLKHLGGFPGRNRDIQGRPYLHFQDYLRWRGRKVKGYPESGLRRETVLGSWNRWVAAHDGDDAVSLNGVKASLIGRYLEGCPYHRCRDEREEQEERRRRESLLRGWQPGTRADERYQKRIKDWREMALDFLCDLYLLRQAAEAISRRYFDVHQLLFPAHTRSLARLVDVVEEPVTGFNEGFANESLEDSGTVPGGLESAGHPRFIDVALLKEAVAPAARQHTTLLVDMARAEALDAMGQNQAALVIVDRHI